MDALSISRHTLPMGSQPLADNSDDELPAETEPIHHPKPDFNTAPVEKRFLGNTQTLSAAQQSFTVPKPPLPPPLNATPKLLHPASESPSSPGCRLFVWGTNHTHQLGLPSRYQHHHSHGTLPSRHPSHCRGRQPRAGSHSRGRRSSRGATAIKTAGSGCIGDISAIPAGGCWSWRDVWT